MGSMFRFADFDGGESTHFGLEVLNHRDIFQILDSDH